MTLRSTLKSPTDHTHVYGRWYPLDRTHVRRVCVMPGCSVREVKRVTA